jgi:hypothetical protein
MMKPAKLILALLSLHVTAAERDDLNALLDEYGAKAR